MPFQLVGEPTIAQEGSNVLMEAVLESDAEPALKWSVGGKDIAAGDQYKFECTKEDKGKFKIHGEILNFDKPLAGVYKVDISAGGQNTSATFTVSAAGDAPEFTDKPKIVQKDGGKILGIKVRAKSKTDATASWTKADKPIKPDDHYKVIVKTEKEKPGEYLFMLEIHMPALEDQAKYRCVVKNKEGSNSQSLNLNFD